MHNKIGILSTKKLRINQKQYLLNAGFAVSDTNFIDIIPILSNEKNINNVLIFTSQNTVNYSDKLIEYHKNKKVVCVGDKTKSLLVKKGFKNTISFSSAEKVTEYLDRFLPNETFTFFCGKKRLNTISNYFIENKISFNEIVVYDTVLKSSKVTAKFDGLLFFSPSAVMSYLKENTITNETCFCIGNTTARELKPLTKNIIIANQPTIENVIIQCINFFKNE
jgi:uroporphyrinogen-III synthase